jgi:hypothetical protein
MYSSIRRRKVADPAVHVDRGSGDGPYTIKTSPEFSAYKARLTEEIRVESIRAAEMGA